MCLVDMFDSASIVQYEVFLYGTVHSKTTMSLMLQDKRN